MMLIKINCAIMVGLFLISYFDVTSALKCYQCTSLDDKKCEDPFGFTNATLKDCPKDPEHGPAALCRKLVQMVNEQPRIIRSCGYINSTDSERDTRCYKVSLTAATSTRYCGCTFDGCNGAATLIINYILPFFAIIGLLKF